MDREIAEQFQRLETRLEDVEGQSRLAADTLELMNLVVLHGVLADMAGPDWSWLYARGGTFEFAPGEMSPTELYDGAIGSEETVTVEISPEAVEQFADQLTGARQRGLMHFYGMPHVTVSGDEAVVVNYIVALERERSAEPMDAPPHGVTRGWRPLIGASNVFECERTEDGWRIARRRVRIQGGRLAAQALSDWHGRYVAHGGEH